MTGALEQFRLDGKVALVTGGARGLGAAIATGLADAGAAVMISDILGKEGRETAEALTSAGHKADFREQDTTVEDQWPATIASTVDTFGGLDILINNAGVERMAMITETSLAEFQWIQQVNVEGVFLGCKHAVAAMRPGGASGRGGSIVNLSSVAGLIGVTALHAYSASKGAVRLLTKTVAMECAQLKLGIRCNSIHPGLIKTAMGDHFLQNFVDLGLAPDIESIETQFIGQVPMGEWGRPEDIANAALYLSSDAARFITGAELVVDGGLTTG